MFPLVLDDSVVGPRGANVVKFAELLGVQPDVIKRLFMLGQVLTLAIHVR